MGTSLPLALFGMSPFLAFGLMMTVIGHLNLENCELNPDIPKWIFIAGLMQVISVVQFIGYKIFHLYLANQNQAYYKIISGLFILAQVGHLIIGNIWIYQSWDKKDFVPIESEELNCDSLTFKMALSTAIVMDSSLVLSSLFLFIIIGLSTFDIVLPCFKKKTEEEV